MHATLSVVRQSDGAMACLWSGMPLITSSSILTFGGFDGESGEEPMLYNLTHSNDLDFTDPFPDPSLPPEIRGLMFEAQLEFHPEAKATIIPSIFDMSAYEEESADVSPVKTSESLLELLSITDINWVLL